MATTTANGPQLLSDAPMPTGRVLPGLACIRKARVRKHEQQGDCGEKAQHWPKKLFLGKGCLKSSRHVVRFGFV